MREKRRETTNLVEAFTNPKRKLDRQALDEEEEEDFFGIFFGKKMEKKNVSNLLSDYFVSFSNFSELSGGAGC